MTPCTQCGRSTDGCEFYEGDDEGDDETNWPIGWLVLTEYVDDRLIIDMPRGFCSRSCLRAWLNMWGSDKRPEPRS